MCPIDPARYRAVREARGLPGPLAGPSGWPRSRPKPENGPRTTSYGSRPGEAAPGYHIDERFDRRGARVPGSGTRAPGRVGRAPGADPGRPQLNKTIKLLFRVIFLVSPAIFNRFFTRFRSTPRFSPGRLLVAQSTAIKLEPCCQKKTRAAGATPRVVANARANRAHPTARTVPERIMQG